MKNLKNILLLKQLYTLKNIGFTYTSVMPFVDNETTLELSSDLTNLQKQALNCHLCQLSKTRTNVVFGEGNPNANLMIVAEAPGEQEDLTAKVFVGRSGELLDKMITNVLQMNRKDLYIANIVKCRPPNNQTPKEEYAYTCLPFIQKQIEIIKPKIIISLGATAYRYLTNDTTSLNKIRGNIYKQNGYTIIPTYHPSYLLRNPSAKKYVFEDLKLIKSLLEKYNI